MSPQIELSTGPKALRKSLHNLGDFHEPVELVINGQVVAKLLPPAERRDVKDKRTRPKQW